MDVWTLRCGDFSVIADLARFTRSSDSEIYASRTPLSCIIRSSNFVTCYYTLPVALFTTAKDLIMCFGSRSSASNDSDSSEPNIKPVTAKEKKRGMSKEEKDKIKMEKGFAAMAHGNAAMVAKRCC